MGRTGEAERPAQHGYHLASGKISKALDVYIWLTYRTYRLDHVAYVSWRQLYDQFEGTGLPLKDFRRRFKQALSNVLEAAPNLKAEPFRHGIKYYPRTDAPIRPVKQNEAGDMPLEAEVVDEGKGLRVTCIPPTASMFGG